jgi:hypothetical protein
MIKKMKGKKKPRIFWQRPVLKILTLRMMMWLHLQTSVEGGMHGQNQMTMSHNRGSPNPVPMESIRLRCS